MVCKKCGGELEQNALFCRFCGNKIEAKLFVSDNGESQDSLQSGFIADDIPVSPIHQAEYDLMSDNNNGVAFESNSLPEDPEYDASHSSAADEDNKSSSTSKKTIIIVLVFVTVIAIIIAIAIIAGNTKNNADYPMDNYYEDPLAQPDYYADDEFELTQENISSTEPTTKYYIEVTEQKLVIASGGLRMRDKPDIEHGVRIAAIPNGSVITIEKIVDGWAYTTYNGISGWCSCDYLFEPSEYEGVPLFYAVVNMRDGLTIHTEQELSGYNVLATAPFKATVIVYRTEGDWSYVEYNGTTGWCLNKTLDEVI